MRESHRNARTSPINVIDILHVAGPGLSSGQKVVDGDLANDGTVQDNRDVLT
jgi:hypothetical protein